MDKRAVERARTEYDRAVQSNEALGRSNTPADVETLIAAGTGFF